MRRRRVLRVELNRHASLVSGHGAHELIRETTGRLPVWLSRLRAFSAQEDTARDVIALAERLGYDVEITGRRSGRERALAALLAAPVPRLPERADPGNGSW